MFWLAAGEDISLVGEGTPTGLLFSVITGISSSEGGAEESDDKGEEEPDMAVVTFAAIRPERGSYVKDRRVSDKLCEGRRFPARLM